METKAELLGHPIHPMLIPFTLGLLGTAVAFDLIDVLDGGHRFGRAADCMVAAGILAGPAAAVYGAVDRSGTRAKRIGAADDPGNVVAISVITRLLRRDEPADPGTAPLVLDIGGDFGAQVTGWLGGELVDRLGVGVDPGAHPDASKSLSGRPAHGGD